MASNDSFEELKTNAEIYKELLGNNKAKTKKLKPEYFLHFLVFLLNYY